MKPSARKHAKAQGGKSLAAAPTHGRRAARHAFARERSAALERALAILEWAADGILLDVNSEGCRLLGRSAEDLIGRRHDVFIKPESRESAEYRALREKLGRGEPVRWQYGLMTGAGGEVWVESFCTPIMDRSGTLARIIEHVIDITAHKLELAHQRARLAAIDKVQAVIEFALDGTILDANENFLKTVGYRLDEIKGRHHSLFVDRATRDSAEYRLFWEKLGRGEYDQGQYRRIGKDGREVWIQASYNPIFDLGGKPYKVIKYATDITEQVRAARQLQAAVEQTQAVVAAASQGDLSQRIPLEGKEGSIAEMCSGINAIIEAMATVVRQIQQAAASVRAAAQEIASGNADLSARTEQQAASLEETASSMEELTSTVKQNADNARQANQLAIGASEVARKGGRVVSDVVATMSAISEASKKIVDIIGVIDGIAFQTNILALNAAVEAARAGEQG
ncbi:methyl-accepting chemotaxis sensory transducer with Pas/Pac sensor, partial [Fontimonas thermophila]